MVNLPDEVREVVADLMDENEKLKLRIAELEDLLQKQKHQKVKSKRRQNNKRDWLNSDDDDE